MLQEDITSALTTQGAAGEQSIIERAINALIEFIRGIFATFCSPLSMLFNTLTGGAPETPPPPPPPPPAQPPYMLIAVFIIVVIAVITFVHFMRELKKDEDGTHSDIAEPEEEQEEIEEPDAAVLGDFSTITPTLNGQKTPQNEDETEPDQGNAAEPEEEQEEIEEIEEIEGEEEEGGAAGEKMDRSFTDSKSEDWAEGLKKALEAYAASGAIENMSFAEWIRQGGERRNE